MVEWMGCWNLYSKRRDIEKRSKRVNFRRCKWCDVYHTDQHLTCVLGSSSWLSRHLHRKGNTWSGPGEEGGGTTMFTLIVCVVHSSLTTFNTEPHTSELHHCSIINLHSWRERERDERKWTREEAQDSHSYHNLVVGCPVPENLPLAVLPHQVGDREL